MEILTISEYGSKMLQVHHFWEVILPQEGKMYSGVRDSLGGGKKSKKEINAYTLTQKIHL